MIHRLKEKYDIDVKDILMVGGVILSIITGWTNSKATVTVLEKDVAELKKVAALIPIHEVRLTSAEENYKEIIRRLDVLMMRRGGERGGR